MKILITPSDLIKRFVWDQYVEYVLDGKNTADINKIIKDDEEFEISEDDAFVIGLTNVVYTTEVIYKFKQFLREILDNKNFEQDNRLYINKQFLLNSIQDFKNKIPKGWISDDNRLNEELTQLPDVYTAFEKGVNALITINVQEWPCVKYAQVKKIINKL